MLVTFVEKFYNPYLGLLFELSMGANGTPLLSLSVCLFFLHVHEKERKQQRK